MAKDKPYSYSKKDNSHYSEPSMYGKIVREQQNARPTYCEPGKSGGGMQGAKSNKQVGP